MLLITLVLLADSVRSYPLRLTSSEWIMVTEEGQGDPVVLLPGLFGSAFGYRKVLPLLSHAGYRALVVEPLGIGTSGRPERANYSLTAQADRVASVLDTLGLRRVVLVAHAVGASMALRLAARRPDLVRAIVSLEGGPAEAAATPGFRRAMRLAPWIKLLGGVRLIRKRIRGNLAASSADPSWVSDSVVDGYTVGASRDLDGTLKAYLRIANAREPQALAPQLERIQCPVRLLLGAVAHGSAPPREEVERLGRLLPRFAVDTVPGTGHFIQEERPDAVVAVVEMIRRQDQATPR